MRKHYHDAYPDEAQYDYDNAGFLYIDASESPGRIASLEFDGDICPSTRITVSAWVSSPNSPPKYASAIANVYFNIIGKYTETVDGVEVEKEEKIYTYCPGPFSGDAKRADGTTLESNATNGGIWQQVYFSFVPSSNNPITHYVLNVNNGCTNSGGGDILIDDIEVYAAMPQLKVTNSQPVCKAELTITRIETDFETLRNNLGVQDDEIGTTYKPSIHYCVVDSAIYHDELKNYAADDPNAHSNAMEAAKVGVIRSVKINTTYDELDTYNYAQAVDLLQTGNAKLWKLTENNVKKFIITDRVNGPNMKPNRKYYLAAYFTNTEETVDNNTFDFTSSRCCISSLFTTRGSIDFALDGNEDLVDGGEATACAGTNVTLSARFRAVDKVTGDDIIRTLPCDWWLDYYGDPYAKAYISDTDGSVLLNQDTPPTNATSVHDALFVFRYHYPDALSTDDCEPQTEGEELTENMLKGLTTLTHPVADRPGTPGRPALLLLHTISINMLVPELEDGETEKTFNVTLQPIQKLVEAGNEDKSWITCVDPNFLTMHVNAVAPGLLNGIGGADVEYPSYMSNVPLRIALSQISDIRAGTQGLRVPLRKINAPSDEATGLEPIELVKGDGTRYIPLYITATDDPDCDIFARDGYFREVGRVLSMSAVKGSSEGYLAINFLPVAEFKPREGYTYTLRVDYKEHVAEGAEPTTCNGSFVFDLKVVPQYVKWTPRAGSSEWTNDRNWTRADRTDLLFADGFKTDYKSNADNASARAFVPLDTTSVLLPAGVAPVLYDSVLCDNKKLLDFSGHAVTQDIEYDLIVRRGTAASAPHYCTYFRTNTCDGLVLQTGAELLQAQHLDYSRAWVEYEVATGRWYTLGTPLQQTFAGEWYAPTDDGRENTPYFHDIRFSTDRNNRFQPAVYQRGWDKAEANLYYLLDPGSNATQGNLGNENVAVRAEWSSVYNDVQETYDQAGFSIKAVHPTASSVLFRLPKEDETYDYYLQNADGSYDHNNTTVTRTSPYRLWTDQLQGKTGDDAAFTLSLKNKKKENLYFLVSNPFPCGLDIDKFFQKNSAVLPEQKYWMLTQGGQSAAIKDPGSTNWITVNSDRDPGVLAPGQGFFVKAASINAVDEDIKLQYTPAMMVSAGRNTPLKAPTRAADATPMLRIRAQRDGYTSEAVITQSDRADNTFAPAEDMEALVDETLAPTPTVYTLAGNRATTVNSRRTIRRVGLGITGQSDEEVTLTFTGMHTLSQEIGLLDALSGNVTPLSNGDEQVTVSVPGQTAGRYFIISLGDEGDSDDSDEADDGSVSITAHRGQVTVQTAGTLTLDQVQAVAPDGRVFHHATPAATVHTFRLAPGIYLITARTPLGSVTRKLAVK